MRHGKKIHRLSRPAEHRRALLNNLASALIANKQIQTTEAKAKALKPYMDRLIATAMKNTLQARRLVGQRLANKMAVRELLTGVVPKLEGRNSGYTRILHYGTRRGDGARLSVIQLLLEEDVTEKKKKTKKKPARKTASRSKKATKAESKPEEESKVEAESAEASEAQAEQAQADKDSEKTEAGASAEQETPKEPETEAKDEQAQEETAEEKPADEAGEDEKKKE